jgi:hypothetical protein
MKQALLFVFFLILSASAGWAQQSSAAGSPTREFAFPEGSLLEARNEVRLFPNPATEYLVVEIRDPKLDQVSFELNNIIGSLYDLRAERLADNRYKIYVKDLPPGYYFLTIRDQDTPYKRAYRFVKK